MTSRRWRALRHGLVLFALVVGLVFLMSSASVKSRVDEAAAWTNQFAQAHRVLGAVIFVLFSAFSAMMAFASSAVLVPPATAVWGKFGAFLFLWAGWTLGAAAAYGIGRLMTPLLIRVGYGKKLVKYRRFVSRNMGFWAVLFFCLAVPSEVPGYLFGSARYRFAKFIAAMAIAESLYALGLVLIGEGLLTFKPSRVLIVAGVIIVVAVLTAPAFRAWRKRSGEER